MEDYPAMKKLLATILAVVMVVSSGVAYLFTSNAANETTMGLQISGFYNQFTPPTAVSTSGGYSIEFDLWLSNPKAGIMFWGNEGGSHTRYTVTGEMIGVERAGGESSYPANDFKSYNWGDTGFTSANHHHVKIDFGVDGSDNIWIDGVKEYESGRTIKKYWADPIIFGCVLGDDGNETGDIVIDNFSITGSYTIDFENGNRGYLNDVSGNLVPVYVSISADPVTTKAAFVDTGYGYFKTYNPTGSTNTVEFDLWLLSDDASITFWQNVNSNNFTIAKTKVEVTGKGSAPYDWGETGITSDNWHHVKIDFGVGGSDTITIDGKVIYNSTDIVGKYWEDSGVMVTGGKGVYVDNFVITNNPLIDFEDGNVKYLEFHDGAPGPDIADAVVDANGGEVACPHLTTEVKREAEPTCQKTGLDVEYCKECGEKLGETTVPTVDHKWPSRYQNVVDHRKPAGLVDGYDAWGCLFNCGTTVKASIPATDKYTGVIKNYYDFDDAVVTHKIIQVFNGFEDDIDIEDGVAKFHEGHGCSYWQNDSTTVYASDNYSVTFDFRYNNTFDSNDTPQYGHRLYFWFGGGSGVANMIGYDFDAHEFFLDSSVTGRLTADYNIEDGEWHTIAFRVFVPDADTAWDGEHSGEDGYYYVSIECDGEELIRVDEFNDVADLGTTQNFSIIRNFGVNCDIDNYVMGSADFRWLTAEERPLRGDVNGDGVINLVDSRLLKLIVAGTIRGTELADVNGDGKTNAADIAALKVALAG